MNLQTFTLRPAAKINVLLKSLQSKRMNAKQLITHHFKLDQIVQTYDTFGRPLKGKALKVIIEA